MLFQACLYLIVFTFDISLQMCLNHTWLRKNHWRIWLQKNCWWICLFAKSTFIKSFSKTKSNKLLKVALHNYEYYSG